MHASDRNFYYVKEMYASDRIFYYVKVSKQSAFKTKRLNRKKRENCQKKYPIKCIEDKNVS
jgi:hypothetical protein